MSYGIKIKLPVSGQITEITGLFPPIYGAYSLTLEFDKYFPYDNGNGQPIYNEDTGAQLRDPVTGQ